MTRDDVQRVIDFLKAESKKLRLVCTCDEFVPGDQHYCMAMVQCKVCRGWLTIEQLTVFDIKVREE